MQQTFIRKFIVFLISLSFILSLFSFLILDKNSALQTAKAADKTLKEDITEQLGTAGETYGATKTSGEPAKTIPEVVSLVIKSILVIIGVILLVLLFYGGFLWMTAQGNEDSLKKARAILTDAIVGIVIVFAAYAFTYFVIDKLLGITQK